MSDPKTPSAHPRPSDRLSLADLRDLSRLGEELTRLRATLAQVEAEKAQVEDENRRLRDELAHALAPPPPETLPPMAMPPAPFLPAPADRPEAGAAGLWGRLWGALRD